MWEVYRAHREEIAPVLAPLASLIGSFTTLAVGVLLARAALKQARTATEQARTAAQQAEVARQQAEVARLRHEEQTKADFQRRTTESFTKAVEQLGSDKVPVRLGGIYTLERISRESEADYWSVMETLTAFVRERTPWGGDVDDADDQQQPVHKLATDVAAVLTVILRRGEAGRKREQENGWRLDLSRSDLRAAHFGGAYLEGAIFREARLEGVVFWQARLEGADFTEARLIGANFGGGARLAHADFTGARLEGAFFMQARLEGAEFGGARLEGALLARARCEGARFVNARLGGAILTEAHLGDADLGGAQFGGAHLGGACIEGAHLGTAYREGTDLRGASGLTQSQIESAFGNSTTMLPEGFDRPAHWSASGDNVAFDGFSDGSA